LLGPVLRRTAGARATVWVQLTEASTVRITAGPAFEITQRLWGDIPAADMAVVRRVLGTVLERAEAELSAASPASPTSSAGR